MKYRILIRTEKGSEIIITQHAATAIHAEQLIKERLTKVIGQVKIVNIEKVEVKDAIDK